MNLSRRDFFKRFIPSETISENKEPEDLAPGECKAIIQGRYCLAYQNIMCSVCYERCPEEAIIMKSGIPSVIADNCTGCKICHKVCPAPINAILLKEQSPTT